MAFNVLKDPKDPRNFIVTPIPQAGIDPNLLLAGEAAGQAGTLARPKARGVSGATAPGTGQTQFGPGSEEAFTQGLINLQGRLNRKRFEQNKAVFEANLARDGLNMNQDGLRQALDQAYKSTNGFEAANQVAQDFFFNQPEQQAQRAVDLEVLQEKEERASKIQIETLTNLQNTNEVFKYDLGLPPARVADDREKFNRRMTLASRVGDAQVLSEFFGTVRFGESTSSEKAAVKTAYANIKRELTIGIGAFSEAGALSDQEREFFGEFGGEFGTLSPIQDSTRRVALADAMSFLSSGANDIKDANRALMRGARPAVWNVEPRTVDQILSRQVPEGLTELNRSEIRTEAQRAAAPTDVAAPTDDFFAGVEDFAQPQVQTPVAAVAGAVGGLLEGASETAQQFTDEEERARIRALAGR